MYITRDYVKMTTWAGEDVRIDFSDIKYVDPIYGFNGKGISITTKSNRTYCGSGSDSDYRKIEDILWNY